MFAYPTRHFQIGRDIHLYTLSFESVLIILKVLKIVCCKHTNSNLDVKNFI